MSSSRPADAASIRTLVENWAIWRDAGDWDRFATVWHAHGHMCATWFQGSAADFIERSRAGFEQGIRILHFLGGTSVDVRGDRALAQTKMTITQRDVVHDVEVDVVCTGRFYDFLAVEHDAWRIVRRQPIYEQDRMDPVRPNARLELEAETLARYPVGYRHLAYLQREAGFDVKPGLPGLTGPAVERLYQEGAEWLAGSPRPGFPA